MKIKYEEIMREVDTKMESIELTGSNIVAQSKEMVHFLKVKMNELKAFMLFNPFQSKEDEITFFKHQKPMLLGRLIYFYKIYRIESKCPSPCNGHIDDYYAKRQEEQKLFFDRHVAFYQYYRSGATYHDAHYFLRGKQEISPETEIYDFDNEPEFSTGYDRLVARIIAMEMVYAYLTARRKALLANDNNQMQLLKEHRWTGKIVDLVELIYALDTCGCIDNGKINIDDLAHYMGLVFNIDIKHCFNTYVDMKKRKSESRTYFLDEMSRRLNERMKDDDEK